jgi:hypothetical protein
MLSKGTSKETWGAPSPAWLHYNIMRPVRAALQASVRYLIEELGDFSRLEEREKCRTAFHLNKPRR